MTAGGAKVDIDAFTKRLLREAETNATTSVSRVLPFGFRFIGSGPQASDRKRERSTEDTENKGGKYQHNTAAGDHMPSFKKKKGQAHDHDPCNLCGWRNHRSAECKHANTSNPDINRNSSVKWKDSTQGKAWLKAGRDRYDASFARPLDKKYYGEEILSCTCDGTCHECIPPSINNNNNSIYKVSSKLLSAFTLKDDYTIPATAITIKDDLPIRFLLDIDALQGNYISKDLANAALESRGVVTNKCNHCVCSAMSGLYQHSDGLMTFYLPYTNVYANRLEIMKITAKVLDIQFDLIIGSPTIKKHELITDKFAYLITTGVLPIHADLHTPVNAGGPTQKANQNSVLAGLLQSERLDNTNPNPISRIQLVQPDLDCNNLEDALSQEPWNENPLQTEGDVLDNIYVEGDDDTKSCIIV